VATRVPHGWYPFVAQEFEASISYITRGVPKDTQKRQATGGGRSAIVDGINLDVPEAKYFGGVGINETSNTRVP